MRCEKHESSANIIAAKENATVSALFHIFGTILLSWLAGLVGRQFCTWCQGRKWWHWCILIWKWSAEHKGRAVFYFVWTFWHSHSVQFECFPSFEKLPMYFPKLTHFNFVYRLCCRASLLYFHSFAFPPPLRSRSLGSFLYFLTSTSSTFYAFGLDEVSAVCCDVQPLPFLRLCFNHFLNQRNMLKYSFFLLCPILTGSSTLLRFCIGPGNKLALREFSSFSQKNNTHIRWVC